MTEKITQKQKYFETLLEKLSTRSDDSNSPVVLFEVDGGNRVSLDIETGAVRGSLNWTGDVFTSGHHYDVDTVADLPAEFIFVDNNDEVHHVVNNKIVATLPYSDRNRARGYPFHRHVILDHVSESVHGYAYSQRRAYIS